MAGYIEKKKRGSNIYYYLTENRRIEGKWKKTRKYLGVHTPAGFEKPKLTSQKHILDKNQLLVIEQITKNYRNLHKIGPDLWREDRDRLVSFIYNTNAIEGNPLTLDETDSVLLGKKINAQPKDVREITNMKKCVDLLFKLKPEINEKLVLQLHKIEMDGILQEAGHYRKVDVRVGPYICPRHEEVPQLMRRFFEWFSTTKRSLHPFELAALVHLRFVRIHPFRDGNGRMARLLMNLVMLGNGYPLVNIFNSEKMLYYLILQEVDAKKRHAPFVKYLYGVFVKQYSDYAKR